MLRVGGAVEGVRGRFKLPAIPGGLKLATVLLVLIASIAVLSTARVFSGTVDEPAHIAAGVRWFSTSDPTYDLEHPPLAQIAAAIGPYLHGARTIGDANPYDDGARILGSGRHYVDTLASARFGEIVFFLILCAAVWAWSRRLTNDVGAAIATLFVVTNPNVLAHAGLATADIAGAAMITLALFAGTWWIERPTWARSIVFAAASGAAVSSRMSAIPFIGGALLVCCVLRFRSVGQWGIETREARGSTAAKLGVMALVALFVIWAAYRFTLGPTDAGGAIVPAPRFVSEVQQLVLGGDGGFPGYLLGEVRDSGWWYYFPVALLVKTPLPLLIAAAFGLAAIAHAARTRRRWLIGVPLACAIVMLGVSFAVQVDVGIRALLPIYPLLAILGAQGLTDLVRRHPTRLAYTITGLLLAGSVAIAVRAYPDNLSYFNPLAGNDPSTVLVDSNLDWGQDLYRLRDTIAARGITDTVRIAYFGTANLAAAGLPRARRLGLRERPSGWVAASETYLAGESVGRAYAWLLEYPATTRIGPSMRLWYIPADSTTDSRQR